MGNSQNCGFGVLNDTDDEVTVILSMGGPHYYENSIPPRGLFYRWPGAVHYTVIAYKTDDIGELTEKEKGWQLFKASVAGVAGVGIAAAGAAAAPSKYVQV